MSKREYLGDDGKFKPALLADVLLKKTKFATIRETEEILWYNEHLGIWETNGQAVVGRLAKAVLGEDYSGRIKGEVIANIMALTYISRKDLNATEGVYPMKNGVYSVKEKKLLPHSPDYYFTSALPFSYNPEARPEKIMAFLWTVSKPDYSLLVSLIEHIAWILMPTNKFQKLALLWGEGSNGKGTYLRLIRAFVGALSCASANLYQLTQLRFMVAGLDGKKVNLAGDMEYTRPLNDTAILKQLRGEDMMTGEFKGGQPFEFTYCGKCFFIANKFPKTTDATYAFNRSFSILQFRNQFRREDGTLKQDIIEQITTEEELSGLFNLVLEFLEVLNNSTGFTFAYTAEEVGELYKERSNSAQVFIDKCLRFDPDSRMFKDALRQAYETFCADAGLIVETEKAFTQTFNGSVLAKCEVRMEGGKRYYKGLTYHPREDEPKPQKEQIPTDLENFIKFYASKNKINNFPVFLGSASKLEKVDGENPVNPVKPDVQPEAGNEAKSGQLTILPDAGPASVAATAKIIAKLAQEASNDLNLTTAEGEWDSLYAHPALNDSSKADIDKAMKGLIDSGVIGRRGFGLFFAVHKGEIE